MSIDDCAGKIRFKSLIYKVNPLYSGIRLYERRNRNDNVCTLVSNVNGSNPLMLNNRANVW